MSERHKHADIIIAWANGEDIQVLNLDGWECVSNPWWSEYAEYRIKPKTVVKKAEVVIYKLDSGGYGSCFSFEHIYNAKVVKRFETEWEEER
jgi:hypothetical protein